jgi:hypothetical protein
MKSFTVNAKHTFRVSFDLFFNKKEQQKIELLFQSTESSIRIHLARLFLQKSTLYIKKST